MTRVRCTMPARSQGKLHMQWRVAELVYSMVPDVEALVRKWLVQWLDSFYCGLQVMFIPRFTGSMLAGARVVLNNARDLSPRLSVCGWPFCVDGVDGVDGVDDVDAMKGGAM